MRTRRSLTRSPLEWHWQVGSAPVPHPAIPVLAERGGTQLRTPRPVLLVDTREQNLFDFSRFEGRFAGIEKNPLKLGDYSVAGLEDVCVVERKDLPDLIHTIATGIALSCWGTDTPMNGCNGRLWAPCRPADRTWTEELGRRRSESLSVANCCGLGEPTRFDIAHRWLAEEASVLAVELTRAFITDFERRCGGIEPLNQHSLSRGN
jgi:hypothetical protein